MHIPDGFLSTPVWAAFDAISLVTIGYISKQARRAVDEPRVPLLGVMGAFVFAAQMINFPVGLGTTGHLLGGTLLAITVGPVSATLVLSVILAIQALVFQDGGLLAWGANVFNMALCGVWVGYLPYHFWGRGRLRSTAIFLGGLLSVVIGAVLALLMLKASGVPITASIFVVQLGLFLVAGVLEGVITFTVSTSIERLNPGWLQEPSANLVSIKKLILGAAVALVLAGILFASTLPDVLERVAEKAGIAQQSFNLYQTPLKDYELSFAASSYLRKATAGLVGIGLVYAGCLLVSRFLTRRRSS